MMGFYIGGSLKAGPFRFNLSTAGIGVSAGVPGFRVGTGPRGSYIRVGGSGVSYTVTSGQRAIRSASGPGPRRMPQPQPGIGAKVLFRQLDGASVEQLTETTSSALVRDIQIAANRISVWPYLAALLAVVALITVPWGLLIVAPVVPAVLWLRLRDQARRSVVVFYDVNDTPAVKFERLATTHAHLACTQRSWQIEAYGALSTPYEQKVNAGASSLVHRSVGTLSRAGPKPLVTNIVVPTFDSARRAVYFLPDRMLVRQGKSYADVAYASLRVEVLPQRFVEGEAVPSDSRCVGTAWQYANAKGGPDRRFKNNRELPIMQYARLVLTNPHGFLMVWDFSRPDLAYAFANSLRDMAWASE